MNAVRRAVPLGTARQIWSALDLSAGNCLIGPLAATPAAFSGGKFAHPTEGFAKCQPCLWAAKARDAPGTICIRRFCS
ncbi:hypothetical protein DSC91_004851 [Paraburkholderia caffeinilytica]|nr:hypothetical protein DSC91_004851 [Paraburkholderia caffeinilytica]